MVTDAYLEDINGDGKRRLITVGRLGKAYESMKNSGNDYAKIKYGIG